MATIPEIRDRLHELAISHGIPELYVLAEGLKRRYNGRRAPERSVAITPEVIYTIKTMAWNNPLMSFQEIAVRVGVNAGRVSEILNGKRT